MYICICMVMDAHVTMCYGPLAVESYEINLLLSTNEHLMANVPLPPGLDFHF